MGEVVGMSSWVQNLGACQKPCKLVNLGALKSSFLNKLHIFQCMGKIFGVEFQRVLLKFHAKYLAHTLKYIRRLYVFQFQSMLKISELSDWQDRMHFEMPPDICYRFHVTMLCYKNIFLHWTMLLPTRTSIKRLNWYIHTRHPSVLPNHPSSHPGQVKLCFRWVKNFYNHIGIVFYLSKYP